MIDKYMLSMINQDAWGLTKQLKHLLKWFASQLARQVESCLEKLHNARPGAINQQDTMILWVEMIEHPYVQYSFEMCNRNKFNKIINDLALHEKNTCIVSLEGLTWRYFDHRGNLTLDSRNKYWRLLDNKIKNFEEGRDELNPRYYLPHAAFPGHYFPDQHDRCPPLPFGLHTRDYHHHGNHSTQQRDVPHISPAGGRVDVSGASPAGSRVDRDNECYHRHHNNDTRTHGQARRSLFDDFNPNF